MPCSSPCWQCWGVHIRDCPESFGKTDIKFATDTIYYFADDWSLAYDYLAFSFIPEPWSSPLITRGRVVACC